MFLKLKKNLGQEALYCHYFDFSTFDLFFLFQAGSTKIYSNDFSGKRKKNEKFSLVPLYFLKDVLNVFFHYRGDGCGIAVAIK